MRGKKNRKMEMLYDWTSRSKILNTQWGEIAALEWMRREVERITASGRNRRKAEIRKKSTGDISLWVDEPESDLPKFSRKRGALA